MSARQPLRHAVQRGLDALRRALRSRVTLGVFAFLAITEQLPAVVDIYASPVYWVLFTPSYLVTMLVYDGGVGLEAIVYPVVALLPVDGHLVWEAGQIVAFYLFAVVVGLLVERIHGRSRRGTDSGATH